MTPSDDRRLRVLLVSPFPPQRQGAHGGTRAVAGLAGELTARYRLALAYLRAADEPAADAALLERCDRVVEVPRDEARSGPGRVLQKARNLAGLARGRPVWATKWAARGFETRLQALRDEWRPDIVQLEFGVMARFAGALTGGAAPVVLTIHDPGHAAAAEALRDAGIAAPLAWLDARAWRRFERKAMEAAAAVVAFTPRDAEALRRLGASTPVLCIPLGHDVPARPADPLGNEPPTILFAGNYAHPPNRDAAAWLAGSILPAVRRDVPEARLVLVGDGPPPVAETAGGVTATGRVPDVGPYLDAAAVVVAPIRTGGGTRVKLLEALAAGKAVVATTRAATGLGLTAGTELLLADSEQAFADAVVRLLRDPETRAALARRARRWAESGLGWDRSARAYGALYDQLLGRAPGKSLPDRPDRPGTGSAEGGRP